MKQKTATLIFSFPRLLFSFIKAWKRREKENYSMRECSCSPWLWVLYDMVVGCDDFTTVKNILRAFMYDIKYLGQNCVLRRKNGWFSPSIYLLFHSTRKCCMSAMLSRAGSVFVLNRFFIWVKMWQNRVGDREYCNDRRSMQVQGMGWSFPSQRANYISVTLKPGYVIFTEQGNYRTMANAKTQDNSRISRSRKSFITY